MNRFIRVLLICGILAPLLYVGSDIVAAMRWEGYSYASQSVSELRAVGAPTRPFLIPVLTMYSALEFAFGWGVWLAAGRKRALRVTAALLIALGTIDLAVAPFFPLRLGEAVGSFSNTMHIILTGMTVLSILAIIGFGAASAGRRFRLYSIVTLVTLIVTGVMSFLAIRRIAAILPTPGLGIRERINIYGYMLWMAVLAVSLLRHRGAAGKDSIDRNGAESATNAD